MVKVVFILMLVAALVHGHAVLLSPVPFNTNPTTTPKCGVAALTTAMTSTAQDDWVAGKETSVTWHLVAGDGGGNVYGAIDPLGGTDFTVPLNFTLNTSGSNVYYTINFIVPAVSCANSPTKLCTVRFYTSSNWNSCTAVSITPKDCTDCEAPPPPKLNCVAVKQGSLSLCPDVTAAQVRGSASPTDINTELVTAYNTNLDNTNVFVIPNTSVTGACKSAYKQLLCALDLPPCNVTTGELIASSQACRAQCRNAMDLCGIQPAHISLYDCNSYPLCPGESDDVSSDGKSGGGSSKGGMSAGGKAALSLFFIGLAAAVGVGAFMYDKQGHLFGYAFDMDAKKIVKLQPNPHNYKAYEDQEASL